jgi:hypothetical protein
MVTNSFGKRDFMHSQCEGTHEHSSFFLFERGGGYKDFLFFPLFPTCSYQVPKGFQVLKVFPDAFPKMFPIAPAFYPIWFAQSSTSLSINYNPELIFVSVLQPKVHLPGGIPNLPRKLLMGKINMASS